MFKPTSKIILSVALLTTLSSAAGVSDWVSKGNDTLNKIGNIGGSTSDIVGNILSGIGGLEGLGGGSITNTVTNLLNNALRNQTTKYGEEYLKATCSLPDFNVGNMGICGSVAGTLTKGANKLLDILNNGLDLGICTVSADLNICQDNYLTEFCKMFDEKVDTMIGDASQEFGKMTDEAKKKVKDSVRKRVQDPLNNILTGSDKFFPITGGDIHTGSDSASSKSDNKCFLGSGTSKRNQKNVYGESINDSMDNFSIIYSNFIDTKTGESSAAAEVIAQCMKQFPLTNLKNLDDDSVKRKLQYYYDICSPANQTRPTESEIFDNRVKTAQQLSKATSPSFAKSITIESEITSDLVVNTNCYKETSLENAKRCQQRYFANQSGRTGSTTAQSLEANYIKTAEEEGAMVLSALETIYPDRIKDTSQNALDRLLPSKRGYFITEAQKQDMKNSLVMSYMGKITEAKKELARISFAKIKECSTPFYAAAALAEISKSVKDARQEAKSVVNQILNSGSTGSGGAGGSGGISVPGI